MADRKAPAPGTAHGMNAELRSALASCQRAFFAVGLFSCVINLLMLTGPLFMLQVYDRVLTSRSMPTLAALTGLVIVLYLFQGLLDFARSRLLTRIGFKLDAEMNGRVFGTWIALGLAGPAGTKVQPVGDLQIVRQYLSGPGPVVLFDLPWVPLYLAIVFLFHAWLGWLATFGALVVLGLAIVNEVRSRGPLEEAMRAQMQSGAFAAQSNRNAEAIVAMGMERNVARQWLNFHQRSVAPQLRASDVIGETSSISKAFRLLLQSLILALGAYLAVKQVITPGVMIAASIIMGRALAPIDQAISQWRGTVAARQASHRLSVALDAVPSAADRISLPEPTGRLDVDGVSATPPGAAKQVLQGIRFSLPPGRGLGIIGPSAAGKSTLARLLVGAWIPSQGAIRIDGASFDQWNRHQLGPWIGYLPQDVELFDGTVRQNIARFDAGAADEKIVAAAKMAGVHEMILSLANGYDTAIGANGNILSAGQRQRIALARALYGDPVLVVLDEPNSNLDAEGDAALTEAIRQLRARGSTAIVIAHRPSAIAGLDLLLMLKDGKQVAFGPKDRVLREVTHVAVPAAQAS